MEKKQNKTLSNQLQSLAPVASLWHWNNPFQLIFCHQTLLKLQKTSCVPFSPHLSGFKPSLKVETFPLPGNAKLAWYHQLLHSKAPTLQEFKFKMQFTATMKQQLTSLRGTSQICTKHLFAIFSFTYPVFAIISISLRGTISYPWGNQQHETPTGVHRIAWLKISTTPNVVPYEAEAI